MRQTIWGAVPIAVAMAVGTLGAVGGARAEGAPAGRTVAVIVEEASPSSSAAELLVQQLGGKVERPLPIVSGFAALVPEHALQTLAVSPEIEQVWRDGRLRAHGLSGRQDDDDIPLEEYDVLPPNRIWQQALGLPGLRHRFSGKGVTVAVLDTGVTRAPDLEDAVAVRVDFTPGLDGIDRFGHGTHMSGIVGGDGTVEEEWTGVAPDASLVSVKVAGPDGATDVSVILAALQWIVSHRAEHRIRVLNLSFGTDSTENAVIDPLNFAIERVWDAGILVVASVGNEGPSPGTVTKPGDDPYVLTVGAADLAGTESRQDDAVAEFSSVGPTKDGVAKPDLVAPGISIVSVRAPDSTADRLRPAARLDEHYFKGTGTSQATAIVSGVAALLFEVNPALTPDEAKLALVASAHGNLSGLPGAGAGLVDAARAVALAGPRLVRQPPQEHPRSSGLGQIQASRGSLIPQTDFNGDDVPEAVSGEIDALGNPWDADSWKRNSWTRESWLDSEWYPLVAVGRGWAEPEWPGGVWSGLVWSPDAWSSKSWSDSGWVTRGWSSKSWSQWN